MARSFGQKNKSNNYYEVLEVPINASQEEISQAYQQSKKTYAVDSIAFHSLLAKEECQAILELLEEAYSILGNPSKRSSYDRARGFVQNISSRRSKKGKGETSHRSKEGPGTKDLSKVQYSSVQREAEVSKLAAINRFSLDFVCDPKMEEKIEACEEFSGEFLRQIREYKGINIPRMSDMMKISKTYIKNIESENLKHLPALVYVRGFVYQYAKTLKLDPNHVANTYINRIKKIKIAT